MGLEETEKEMYFNKGLGLVAFLKVFLFFPLSD
jgi:hypothetical protein